MTFPRKLIVFCALCAGLASGQNDQPGPQRTLDCIADLPLPGYEGLVWRVRAQGSARVSFSIGQDGKPISIGVEATHPLLGPWLKDQMQSARFRAECAGGILEINLVYRLTKDVATAPQSRITFKGPNTFEITAYLSPPFTYAP